MSCCIKRGHICIPKGDSVRVLVSVWEDGDESDISGADDIILVVSDGQELSGSMYAGGANLIEKRLGAGITKAGTDNQFWVQFDGEDTADLIRSLYYFEVAVIEGGSKNSILCGNFQTVNTQIQVGP